MLNFGLKILQFFKKEKFWLYFLLVAGLFIRLFYIFAFTKPEAYLWSDAGGYDARALQMARGEHVAGSTYWPPFFHIFLSLIYRPLVWLNLENLRIKIDIVIFAIFYLVGFWCIYQITKKLFSKKIALILLAVLILWYPFIFFNYLVMSENLFFPLVFLGLYFLIVKPLKPSTGLWLGLFWGLAFLSRPVFALAIPFFLIWGFIYKLNWKILASFIITVSLIIGSMMLFNFYYTKGVEKSFSSNGGVGFAALWCDAKSIQFNSNGYFFGFGWPGNIDYPDIKRIFTKVPFENQKYYYKMGLMCFKQHPERLATNISSVAKLFNSHLFPPTPNALGWQTFRIIFNFLNIALFIYSIITIVGLLNGFIKLPNKTKKYFYLMALIILSLFITLYLQNPGEERYLIPYAPLLMILSIPFLSTMRNLVNPK